MIYEAEIEQTIMGALLKPTIIEQAKQVAEASHVQDRQTS